MVRRRHRPEGRQVRARADGPQCTLAEMRRLGSGAGTAAPVPASAWSSPCPGHRDLSAMITHHSGWPDASARTSALARGALAGARRVVRAVGRQGLAGPSCSGDDVPIAARLAIIGEYVEVAHRVGGVAAARACSAPAAARSSTRTSPTPSTRPTTCCWPSWTSLDAWEAVIGSEPALTVRLSEEQVRRGAAGHRGLRRPEVAVLARARARPSRTWPRRPARPSAYPHLMCAPCAGRPRALLRQARRLERDPRQAGAAHARRARAAAHRART